MANFKPDFQDVSRAQAKASVAIMGLAGKGKTGLAITMGYILAGGDWQKVYLLDSENRSANLFEGIAAHIGVVFGKFKKFDLLKVHGFKPSNYIAAKEAAIAAGGKVFVADSISHAWNGPGGVLQMVSKAEAENKNVNKFNAWGVPEIMYEKDLIFEMIRDSEVHMIVTIRQKEKFELITGEGIKSLGEQPIMMPDLKFEPDLVLEMVQAGTTTGRPPRAKVIKSRYAIFDEGETYDFTEDVLIQLRDYLAEGVDPATIMEAQRQDFIREIQSVLDGSKSKQAVWAIYKTEYGYADTPLADMPLEVVRKLLSRLLS